MSYYSEFGEEYIQSTLHANMEEAYALFEPFLKENATLLDVGFGSARDMLHFREKGYEVYGIDVESLFVSHALELGLNAEIGNALDYKTDKRFDGIWACASLLHLPKKDLGKAIDNLLSLLRENGVLFISMKEGDFEGVDEKGRPMLLVKEDAFRDYHVLLTKRTLEQPRGITWLNLVLSK